ncbi:MULTISPECIES: S9 family peptidase [Streptomyces]|uniref:Dipeptidyl-peptidase-4 n=1 Tax=Streptomyces griseoaurantiacus TaxID=68213 RepID=A0A1G7GQQ8_9ACTN|nr:MULTISPECIES: prolyl oligopeptidase family serine peptidase [Streptomyces]MCF0086764.1 Dipeptidyl aminopeptidase 4 [Streptomyces sp. MH192]MCF0100430.1 Dipeptidyl aminopeptidase 4 [Streptomyces sp. MH191]MDX3091706.1 prolyl oligopeptidase family serine peptidase [Streptomyces sp. ME12-02E]MDX3335276.1 prolyl oligopeptidase family serine peptidase [Streptomyces sp. ME02-6978a]SDE90472.1 dipeptidyl-peptidase-4 [Streptomyces jietaisiensis]
MTTEPLSFPRQHARTQRFTLGAPRAFTVAPDGSRVVFLRSASGTDRVHQLWVLDTEDGAEHLAADPAALLSGAGEELPPEERARRERSREGGAGIVGYATDAAVELASFALSGRLFTAELRAGTARELPAAGPVIDPRPSPDGRHVAYVARGALRVVGAEGEDDRALLEPESEGVSYGLAEFVAAEEMSRSRGFWWAPDSERLLVARVDDTPVQRWWIADPAHPGRAPQPVAYPAAGTDNAEVRLFVLGLDGVRTEVAWDRAGYPYLARVHWSAAGAPLILVQARDQRSQLILAVDPHTGATRMVHADEDPTWLELFPGVPCWSPSGQLVRIADEGGARVLAVGERPLTGPQLHVRAVLDVSADDVLVSAGAGARAAEPEIGEVHVYRVNELGMERVSQEPGVHSAVRAGGVTVLVSAVPDRPGSRAQVLREGKPVVTLASYAESPNFSPRVTLVEGGARKIPCAVLMPTDYPRETDGPRLPVLMDPYGGPHGQRVLAAHNPHLTSQWFADQGFAVVVADGRGTPGRSPAWEKAVRDELADVVLQDQVDALHALAEEFPLDLDRVAIRGWSFGGYLAALGALRRPDVFHAAVVGAPVTDLRLYDTHYQERYLGLPAEQPEVYRHNSLIDDAGLVDAAEGPHRPMMIIHGLADDNVVVAHSLRLSSALLAAGRPHEVLPLSGVTHMTPQETVAENLLRLQLDFLRRSLKLA